MLPTVGFWMGLFWLFVVVLVIVGFAQVRARLNERLGDRGLDDQDIRTILETGRLDRSDAEPLDMDHIEEEERRFWESEGWDQAEEW